MNTLQEIREHFERGVKVVRSNVTRMTKIHGADGHFTKLAIANLKRWERWLNFCKQGESMPAVHLSNADLETTIRCVEDRRRLLGDAQHPKASDTEDKDLDRIAVSLAAARGACHDQK